MKVSTAQHGCWLPPYLYKLLKKFGGGTTQKEMQERYGVRPKQLALYITGRKYLGGTDRKALVKKQRATGDEPEAYFNKQVKQTTSPSRLTKSQPGE